MGNLKKCIPGYYPAEKVQDIFDKVSRWKDTFGDTPEGIAKAERAVLTEEVRRKQKQQQQVALSALAWDDIKASIDAGGDRAGEAFAARLVRDYKGVASDRVNAEGAQHAVRTHAQVKAAALMELAAGTPAREAEAVSDDLLRALSGQTVENKAVMEAAASWTKTAEWLKAEFNRLGGDIKKRADWLFPQTWDRAKVFPRGVDEAEARNQFVADLLPLYAEPDRMHPIMGEDGAPLTGDALATALADVADGIRVGNTTGTIGVLPGALKNRHRDPRVIGFRNVEDRIAFAKKYGNPNAFDVMDGHIATLSREIGLMRVLGPNPDYTYALARDLLAEKGYGGRKVRGRRLLPDSTKLSALDATYLSVSGALSKPGDVNMAALAGGFRSALSAGLLPLSIASQFSDIVPVSLAAAFNGLPVMQTLREGFAALKPLAAEDRAFLVRLGVDLDSMSQQLAQAGVMESASRSRWLVETTLRFNGARKWQEAWYTTMQRRTLGRMADLRGMSLKEADAAMNGALSRYGWSETDWNLLRQEGVFEHDGAAWMSVSAIEESDLPPQVRDGLISKLITTAQTEARVAMTMPDARVRAAMGGGMPVGTAGGEIVRTLTQFKSFGTQLAFNQIGRILSMESAGRRFKYGSALLAGSAALGALTIQVKRALKGQEPADTDPNTEEGRAFWVSALLQGGGFGILGDLASSAFGENRFGQDPLSSVFGPGFGALGDVASLTFGNTGQMLRGEDTNAPAEAIRLAGRYAPLVNLPFFGIATQRLVVDQLRLMADPDGTRRSFMSMEQQQREKFNSRYWWRPGKVSPEFLR